MLGTVPFVTYTFLRIGVVCGSSGEWNQEGDSS